MAKIGRANSKTTTRATTSLALLESPPPPRFLRGAHVWQSLWLFLSHIFTHIFC